jgi:hypothetical protein
VSVCPLIDDKFRQNIVKVAVDPPGAGYICLDNKTDREDIREHGVLYKLFDSKKCDPAFFVVVIHKLRRTRFQINEN